MGRFPLTVLRDLSGTESGQVPLTMRRSHPSAEPRLVPLLSHPANTLFTTNHTFAGRSARRRMYHGNQCSP